MIRQRPSTAFTLIELLVVVTIIVVLLALLTPALDKAIYQAELTSCGPTQSGLGRGVLVYTADHRRYYPRDPKDDHRHHAALATGNYDGRLLLRKYTSIKGLRCPLSPAIDLDNAIFDPTVPLTGI